MSREDKGRSYEYDICLSFAGEQRTYVRAVADALTSRGVRVFYDEYEEVELWGKDLYTHLSDIYQNAAEYCVLFASKKYGEKLWTSHERTNAQARAFEENKEYILPARFDDTEIPGLTKTIGYIDLNKKSPDELADLIEKKLGKQDERKNYMPPEPDRLFRQMKLKSAKEKVVANREAHAFFKALARMSDDEKWTIFNILVFGCAHSLPENVHISLDLLRRVTEFPVSKIKRELKGLGSLGFTSRLYIENLERDHDELNAGEDEMISLAWNRLASDAEPDGIKVACAMVRCAASGYCEEHSLEALMKLDFSQLSTSTAKPHRH